MLSNQRRAVYLSADSPVLGWCGMGSNPPGEIYFHFEYFATPRSEQLSKVHANEIKHDHSHEVIVVLDPRYD